MKTKFEMYFNVTPFGEDQFWAQICEELNSQEMCEFVNEWRGGEFSQFREKGPNVKSNGVYRVECTFDEKTKKIEFVEWWGVK